MKLNFTFVILFFVSIACHAKSVSQNSEKGGASGYDEKNPVVTPDGQKLYLTIANHPQNVGGKKDPGDIWICRMGADNQWSEPVHGGSKINDRGYNGVAGFSSDGGEMFLLTHYASNGEPARTQGLSVSRKAGEGWSHPENISIPYFQNKSNIISGFVSPDKRWFLYSAETYGSYGVEDIFICERKADGKWSEPKNLGAKINTQFQEISPSLSADGRTLYFSTNGRKGNGSFDVYSATRLDDSWSNWTNPVNVSSVNTEGRDLYYREFPALGYALFTKTNNSDLYGEVRTYKPAEPFKQDTTKVVADTPVVVTPVVTTPVIEEKKYDPTVEHQIALKGKVFNAKTGESIPARVTFVNVKDNSQTIANANAEGYSSNVKSLNQYSVRVESKGYVSIIEKLDVQSFEMENLEMNFKLQPAEVGTTVNLKSVLFVQSKTDMLPESYDELNLVVSFLKENPNVKIELSGHTDNRGVPFQNVKLSQGRVDRVKEYLVSKGIEAKRISGKGYGGAKPIASNESEETRKLNRRVEFTIEKN